MDVVNRHNLLQFSENNEHHMLIHRTSMYDIFKRYSLSCCILRQNCFSNDGQSIDERWALSRPTNTWKLPVPVSFHRTTPYFQHDGASTQFSWIAREWLDANLQGLRLLRMADSPISPDLTICDFWLWPPRLWKTKYSAVNINLFMICLSASEDYVTQILKRWFGRVIASSWSVAIFVLN